VAVLKEDLALKIFQEEQVDRQLLTELLHLVVDLEQVS
jgi:hypothetical protein